MTGSRLHRAHRVLVDATRAADYELRRARFMEACSAYYLAADEAERDRIIETLERAGVGLDAVEIAQIIEKARGRAKGRAR